MDELSTLEAEAVNPESTGSFSPHKRRGPKKKITPRSEKLSCRLTKEEKARGEEYCKAYGLTEAKLLRASYLAVITQSPDCRLDELADALAQQLTHEKQTTENEDLRARIRKVLKKTAYTGMLILLGCMLGTAPTIAKYLIHEFSQGVTIYHGDTLIFHHDDDHGFELVPGPEHR
jgi:hypothetical protein